MSEVKKTFSSLSDPTEDAKPGFSQDFETRFVCPEESSRYSGSLEQLVFNRLRDHNLSPTIIEFGSGTGTPVISAILNSGFSGTIHGYEIGADAAATATRLIDQHRLGKHYVVYNESFFDSPGIPKADYLIANPPYIPADNAKDLVLPYLHGGSEGNDVSKKLLSSGYKNALLEVSSYSNPVDTVEHARKLGYKIIDFQINPLPFGIYSRQDIVWKRLQEMRNAGKAFFSKDCYLVGSAFFTKAQDKSADLSGEFVTALTALRPTSGSAMNNNDSALIK